MQLTYKYQTNDKTHSKLNPRQYNYMRLEHEKDIKIQQPIFYPSVQSFKMMKFQKTNLFLFEELKFSLNPSNS